MRLRTFLSSGASPVQQHPHLLGAHTYTHVHPACTHVLPRVTVYPLLPSRQPAPLPTANPNPNRQPPTANHHIQVMIHSAPNYAGIYNRMVRHNAGGAWGDSVCMHVLVRVSVSCYCKTELGLRACSGCVCRLPPPALPSRPCPPALSRCTSTRCLLCVLACARSNRPHNDAAFVSLRLVQFGLVSTASPAPPPASCSTSCPLQTVLQESLHNFLAWHSYQFDIVYQGVSWWTAGTP